MTLSVHEQQVDNRESPRFFVKSYLDSTTNPPSLVQALVLLDSAGEIISPAQATNTSLVADTGTVTTAGTIVRLTTTATSIKLLKVFNTESNSGKLWVGNSAVLASAKRGLPIFPGGSADIPIDDLSKVYFDADGNAHTFSVLYFA